MLVIYFLDERNLFLFLFAVSPYSFLLITWLQAGTASSRKSRIFHVPMSVILFLVACCVFDIRFWPDFLELANFFDKRRGKNNTMADNAGRSRGRGRIAMGTADPPARRPGAPDHPLVSKKSFISFVLECAFSHNFIDGIINSKFKCVHQPVPYIIHHLCGFLEHATVWWVETILVSANNS